MTNQHSKEQIQKIKERFKPFVPGLFVYRVDSIKEVLSIQIVETTHTRANVTLRIVSSLYRDEKGKPATFYLPIGEISPQYDLKNALVKIFHNTLKEFVHCVIESPFEKPGLQKYLLLKLLFLLDQPGICYLFLKADQKTYNEYKLSDNSTHNARLVNMMAHNIGGFLKDEQIKKIFNQLGREEDLEWWYGEIAIAKLSFLVTNGNILATPKRKDDLRLLKLWFFQRYDLKNAWIALTRSMKSGYLLWLVVILSLSAGFLLLVATALVALQSGTKSNIALIMQLRERRLIAYCFSFAYIVPLLLSLLIIIWVLLCSITKPLKRDGFNLATAVFEIFNPRLFTAIIISYSVLYLNEEIWTFILSEYFHNIEKLLLALFIPFLAAGLYIYTKSKNDNISDAFFKTISVVGVCVFLSMLIGTLLSTVFVGDFMGKFTGKDPKMQMMHKFICLNELPIWKSLLGYKVIWCEPFSLLFWLGFSVFAGIFFQLFWQQEKITQPI